MLSVTSRWKQTPAVPVKSIAIAAADGGEVLFDERGQVVMLDAAGNAQWSFVVEDSLRRVAIAAGGKASFVLGVRGLSRHGTGGKAIWHAAPPPFPLDLAVRADGAVVAATAESGTVRTWNTAGKEAWTRRIAHACDFVQVIPDSTGAVVVSRRGDVTLLAPTGEPVWKVNLGVEAGRPDVAKDRVVVPSFDGVACFTLDGASIGVYDVGAPTVRAMLGGNMLLVQDARRRVLLLDVATGDTRWELTLNEDPREIAFAPDGSAVLIATWAGDLERLDVADVARATSVAPAAAAQATGAFLEVAAGAGEPAADAIAMAPRARWRVPIDEHGDHALLPLPHGAGVVLLDRAAGTVQFVTGAREPAWSASHLGGAGVIASSSTGSLLAAGGPHGLRLFTPATGEIANAPIAVRALAVAAGGSVVLAGAANARLHLLDARGRALWDVPTPGFDAISISPDGNLLVLVRGGTISAQVRGGRGGFTSAVAPDRAGAGFAAHVVALDDGVAYATRAGRIGLLAADGGARMEDALPPGSPVEGLVRAGGEIIVVTAEGSFRLDRAQGKARSLPAGPARRPDTRILYGVFMDRLVEFRYDSKEIACLDPVVGAVVWKRAMGSSPQAISVSAAGSALAGIVGGELVLYDLVPATSAEPATGSGSPSSETPPTFLEL